MAININNLPKATQVKNDKVEQNVQRQQASVQLNATQQATQKQDSVSITAQAKQFAKLTDKAMQSSGVNQEKVDKIKQAIANGEYKIDVEKLAKNIVQFEGELFDKK